MPETSLKTVVSRLGLERTVNKIQEAEKAPGKRGTFGHKSAHPFEVVRGAEIESEGTAYIVRYNDELYRFAFWMDSWGNFGDLSIRKVEEKKVMISVFEPVDRDVIKVQYQGFWRA